MSLPEPEVSQYLAATVTSAEVTASPRPATLAQSTRPGLEYIDAPFLIFRVNAALFAVPALAVRTIHALPELSPLQETAPFIVGIFNLRGNMVPVMDLNARFGNASPPYMLSDNIIVLNWAGAEVALIASEVRSVGRIPPAAIEEAPEHGRRHDLLEPFVAGVAQIDEGIVMLLNLPNLLHWPAPVLPAQGAAQAVVARRFDTQIWPDSERLVLQQRAERLRPDAEDDDEHLTADRAPVAVVAMGGEEFGIKLEDVREFAVVSSVATVPCCPPHILGQINLRGDIVTIIDARPTLRTAQAAPRYFETAGNGAGPGALRALPIVVVQHEGAPVGIVIDEVRGVLYLQGSERRALDSKARGDLSGGKYFDGGALHQGRLLPLLDVTRLFADGGLEVEENG